MIFNQAGGVRLYGIADAEMPFPLLCRRPIATVAVFCRVVWLLGLAVVWDSEVGLLASSVTALLLTDRSSPSTKALYENTYSYGRVR